MRHTQGPWSVDDTLAKMNRVVSGHGGEVVAEILACDDGEIDAERDANARLIAAAPDLLRVVRALDSAAILLVQSRVRDVNVDELLEGL